MSFLTIPSPWVRYGLAVFAVAIASLAIRYLPIVTEWEKGELLFFYFSITLVVFWLGLYPGLLALSLSLISINSFVLASVWIENPADALMLNLGFCLLSCIFIVTSNFQQQFFQQLSQHKADLALSQTVGQIGNWRFNVKNDVWIWSDETYRIFGIPVGTAVTYNSFLDKIHPDDRKIVEAMEQAALLGAPYDIEHRIIVDGQIKWIHEKAVLECSKDGKLLSGFGITQEITLRKIAEIELQNLIDRYELVLNGAQDAIWDWDVPNKRVLYSSRWKTLRGFSAEEIGTDEKHWSDGIFPDDKARVLTAVQAHFEGKTPVFCEEYRILCKDGTWKWVLDRGIAKRDAAGQVIRMAGSEKDITDRKEIEKALLEREQELEIIINLSPDLICYLNTDFRYVRVNKTFETWWGKELNQIIGKEVREIIGESSWNIIQPYLERARLGEQLSFDKQFRQGQDSSRWVNINYVPDKDEYGHVKGIVAQISNITDRKLAEQALRDTEERMRLSTQATGVGLWEWNLSTNKIRWDAKMFELYDIPDTNNGFVDYETWANAVFAEDLPEQEKALQAAIKTQNFNFRNFRIKRQQDKAVRYLQSVEIVRANAHGEPEWVVGTNLDITDRKYAEIGLIERENEVRLIMNLTPALIAYLDPDLKYVRANKTYEDWFSVPVKNIIGHTVPEIVGERAWEVIHTYLERAQKGEQVSYEHRLTFQNNTTRWVKASLVPDLDASNVLKGIVVHVADIEESKKAELALAKQEHELSLIINAMPALIAYVDTDFRYVRANSTYTTWLGISAENIIGKKVKDILGETAWLKVSPYINRAMSGERVHYELEMPYKTAPARWIYANYVPDKDASGNVKGIVALIIDISELKQAEQEIAELNQRLQHRIEELETLFNTVPIGLCITNDSKAEYIRGNKAIEHLLGLPPDSELSLGNQSPPPIRAMINGYEPPPEELPMQRAVRGEIVSNQVLEVQNSMGEIITVLVNAAPLFNEQGKPRGAIGAFLDISAIKNAESALLESEERLRIAQKAGSLGIFDHKLLSNELRWDDRIRELWGLKPHETISLATFLSAVHPGDRKSLKAAVIRSFDPQNNGEYHVEYRVIRPSDKQMFWVAAFGITSFVNDKPVRMVGFVQDITERKNIEQALLDTETQLSLAMTELKAGYWEWKIDTNQVYYSPIWKQQLGYEDHELPNEFEEWQKRLHPDDSDKALEVIDRFIKSDMSNYEIEFRLQHKDGSYRWIHSRAALFHNNDDQPARMIGIHLDVTDFIKLNEMNQQREKMEETFRFNIASQTLAAIAHELNQPLTAISYFADAAMDMVDADDLKSQKLCRVLENCSEQSQRAGQVIRQLLSLLQRAESVSENVDINQAVKSVYDLTRSNDQLKGCQLILNLGTDLPLVNSNDLQIQKVLITLISNAIESMQECSVQDRVLTITTGRSVNNPDLAQITVCDKGTGVTDAEMLNTIFNPFYTTKTTGLGMGLAISRSLIETYGGKMWAEQNADAGLSVHFTLPFAL